jgi:hypothetical protein
MSKILLALVAGGLSCVCMSQTSASPSQYRNVQYESASTLLAGTWPSADGKPFFYTFSSDGTYTYVGSMGGDLLRTQISESGRYSVSGNVVTIQRQRGVIVSSNGYQQALGPETTVGRIIQNGSQVALAFPDGRVFLK